MIAGAGERAISAHVGGDAVTVISAINEACARAGDRPHATALDPEPLFHGARVRLQGSVE